SDAARQIYGHTPQSMLGECPLTFTPAHMCTYKDWISRARKDHGWHNAEREIRRKDGSRGWVTVNGRAVFDSANTIIGFRGAITDTTERHSFIEQLLQSEQRTNDAVRIADGCIFDLDTDGCIIYVSDNAKRLFGADPEDLIGKPTYTLAPDLEPRHLEWLETIRASDGGLESEIRMSPLDGRPDLWTRTICRMLTNDEGELIGYRGIALDVTARKQAALEIIRAKQAAEAAAEERARFLSTMSHEIRTPLNAMIGMTDLLLDMPQSEEQKNLTNSANTAGRHLLGLVNDILDFSKLDAGKLVVEQTPFELEEEINTVRDMLAASAREKHLALEVRINRNAQGCFVGDASRIRQILVNLVGNAI
ncbi:MAG: PAS domain S-box protein, partial [Mariprofundaceae bacterium]|nr:PAS domain S-box protein [Mariprofundaceae bacterium]